MLAITTPEETSRKFSVDTTGIEFHEELSFDEWNIIGSKIVPMAKTIGFVVGDWINYGESRYGEKYVEALRETKMTLETLKQFSYVARNIEKCRRLHVLDWSHHQAVAKVKDPDEQSRWLNIAENDRMSVRRLRKSISAGRPLNAEEIKEDPADRGYVTYLALLNRIRRWWARETGKAPVEEWDEERREGLKKDFKLILDIYEAL
jgi:hypothetical protein